MNGTETIRFPVAGMTCTSCVNRITRSLRKLDGVTSVKVDLGHETATVSRDPDRAPDAVLAAAISDAGYRADLDARIVGVPTAPHGLLARILTRPRW